MLATPTSEGWADGQLRVIHVLTRFNVGGPARTHLELRRECERRGAPTLLVGGRVQEGEIDLAVARGEEEHVVWVDELGRRVRPFDDLRAVLELYRLFRRLRPDVVHTHMAKAGAVGRIAALLARVPVRIHTFHGHTLHGYFGRATTSGVVLTERVLARISTALVAVSTRVRDELLAAGVGRPEQYRVIDVGLDLAPYRAPAPGDSPLRARLGIPRDAVVVGFAGRLAPVKGVDVLLRAAQPLLAARPELHVLVAGDGPDMALVRSATREEGGDRLHALGWVSDMPEFHGAVDVAVLTSRNEGTPQSLIESAAMGIPVVATGVGGVPEVVVDGETGFLVPTESPDAVRQALEALVEDAELRERMGRAARSSVWRFEIARHADALMDLYEQATGRAPRHHLVST